MRIWLAPCSGQKLGRAQTIWKAIRDTAGKRREASIPGKFPNVFSEEDMHSGEFILDKSRLNEIFFRILRGEYALGAKLPSYIEIAKEAGSSPETVRKAIRELQQHSVIEKTRWGYFVSSDEAVIAAYRQQYLESIAKEYRSAIAKLEN